MHLRGVLGVVLVLGAVGRATAVGSYYEVSYPASDKAGELALGVTYTLWVPEGAKPLRGVIVHQHGCGSAACKGGATAAYDLQWQALAKAHGCALLGPSYHQEDGQDCRLWCDPQRGSYQRFLQALADLGKASGHAELARVPWCLWGHSGGGFWASLVQTLAPERVVAVWCRSGTAYATWEKGQVPRPELGEAVYRVPVMLNPGAKEKGHKQFDGAWTGSLAMFQAYRAKGAPIGFAPDPRTVHECGDSRTLAIPYFDACLRLRLPEKVGEPLKPIDPAQGRLAEVLGDRAVPAEKFAGKKDEAVWLPGEKVARAWEEYVRTGAVGDATPPPAPVGVKAAATGQGVQVTWDAEADLESGLRGFVVLRDGKEVGQAPEKPVGRFGRAYFQVMSYHDTPEKPLPEMRFVDRGAPAKAEYRVVAVNGVGLRSAASAAAVVGEEKAAGDEAIDRYLAGLTERVSRRVLDGAKTRAEWEARLPRLRQEYLDMLGLWPLPERTPLHATVTGILEHEGVVIEKLHYQSRPGLYVTANLYRPKQPAGRLPGILYVCGHSGRGRDGNKTAFQDHGLWFAKHGYVCLVVDTLQLGEIAGIHHGTYREGRWWWQARGYTPAGVECWNGIRGLDYLASRPDVDAERLGVTGISGGGAATFWIAAADPRVQCAVPVSGMSDLESYVTHKVVNGHCDCMFLVNTYAWEWTTIAALVAPRPLLFANSDKDPIFPMDGNRRIMERLRTLYALYDKPELLAEHVSPGGHDYRPDLRVAVFRWLNRHLKQDTGPVADASFKPLPGRELRVFPEDKDLPKDSINARVDEVFVPKAVVKLPAEGEFPAWKKGLTAALREQCFRSHPDEVPAAQLSRSTFFGFFIPLTTEPGVEVDLVLLRGQDRGKDRPTLMVLNPGDVGPGGELPAWPKEYPGNGAVLALLPRGVLRPWTHKNPPNTVERAHVLLGRTVDDGRVWDVRAVVRYLNRSGPEKGWKAGEWILAGRGQAGVIAAHAALAEPSVKEVVLVDPPASHREGPIFLNVLRVLDVPEALGLLAPEVRLIVIGGQNPAFERTANIYEAAGASGKFQRKDQGGKP